MDYEFKKIIVLAIIEILNENKTVSITRLSARTGYSKLDIYDCLTYVARATKILTKIHNDGTLL